jgi:hypothetical protein
MRAGKNEKMVRVEDMMEIAGVDPSDKAILFVVVGDPPMQKHNQSAWRHIFRTWSNKSHCRNPIIYDPSAREKVAFCLVV